jgi:DNA invertase Pin-like site-specific DNA recombinase
MKDYVAYYRVSTRHQGINGLGMDAQRQAVAQFLQRDKYRLLGEFAEVESGKRNNREELNKAIALCRQSKATLLIAKLDRLARNAAFVLNLRDSGVDFLACDMPDANKLTIGIMALVAEQERDWISERTKAGLAAAKRRGIKLGNPHLAKVREKAVSSNKRKAQTFAASLAPVFKEIAAAGVRTLKGIARCLNARGFKTPQGKAFTRQAVARVLRHVSSTQRIPATL